MRQHYTGACRTEKSRLLDEFIRVTGYHRKSAVRGAVGHQAHQVGQGAGQSFGVWTGAEGRPLGGLGPSVRQALGAFRG